VITDDCWKADSGMQEMKYIVDVIIPTYKPDRRFYTLLERLKKQTYKINKIIIINTDEDCLDTSAIETMDGVEIHHIDQKEFDHGTTRNYGVSFSNADIVVFVESLEARHRFDARLSFSTKLTDYFASGKCIFAIGDEGIAPIQYLRENDAAVIATDYADVQNQLTGLLKDSKRISQYGRKAFECGRRNHEQATVKRVFTKTIQKAANRVKE
jgi:glycosyltransferase involved in cell wall biosynthesis